MLHFEKGYYPPFGILNHSLQRIREVFMSQNIQGVHSSAKGHFHKKEGLRLISISNKTHKVRLAAAQPWKMFLILNCVCALC